MLSAGCTSPYETFYFFSEMKKLTAAIEDLRRQQAGPAPYHLLLWVPIGLSLISVSWDFTPGLLTHRDSFLPSSTALLSDVA